MLKFDKFPPDWRLVAITIFVLIGAVCAAVAFAQSSIVSGFFGVLCVAGAYVSSRYRSCLVLNADKRKYQYWRGFVGNKPPIEGDFDEISCVEVGYMIDNRRYLTPVSNPVNVLSTSVSYPVSILWKKSHQRFLVDNPNDFSRAAHLASGISEFANIQVQESPALKAFRSPLREAVYDHQEISPQSRTEEQPSEQSWIEKIPPNPFIEPMLTPTQKDSEEDHRVEDLLSKYQSHPEKDK